MFRKRIAVAALSLCGAAALVGSASTAKAVENPFELTLGGSASNGSRFDGFSAAASGSIGYYLTENVELGIRQSVSYSDAVAGTSLDGSTRAAVDFNFPLGDHGQIVPYIGANIGYDYGKGITDTWEAAPEGGIKLYVNASTFIYTSVEYQFFFRRGSDVGNNFKDGQFIYSLGVGFRF